MSLAPSTDLVLEVSRAADPTRAGAVRDKLASLSTGAPDTGDGFQAALGAAAGATAPLSPRPGSTVSPLSSLSPAKKAQRMLESAFLTQFIEEMLPKDAPSAFGQGYAGDMWRSMLAQRVADQVAASGRLGIGDRLFANRPLEGRHDLLSPEKMRGLAQADATVTSAPASSTPGGAAAGRRLVGSSSAL
jgi:flagellar protein FlgJ